jgi:VIT1/CCC1 family predicted Fe2+/Mn2+ transporter
MERNHYEEHYVSRVGWLRAAVLGANDGIVSTAALIVVVAAASDRSGVMLAGMAGLAAGALSMAAGEYVSVSSQADTEKADTERERAEIEADPEEELRALAGIYEDRGLSPDLALQVATALHAKDPLAAHLRDELGFSQHSEAKPLVAAGASALSPQLCCRGGDADGGGFLGARSVDQPVGHGDLAGVPCPAGRCGG